MSKWHTNDKTGKTDRCRATTADGCPFGTLEEHYDTKAEALYAYETKNADKLFANSMSKPTSTSRKSLNKKMYKFMALGGVALSSMSLVGCESDISVNDDGGIEITVEGEKFKIDTDTEGTEEEGSGPEYSPTDEGEVLWKGRPIQPSAEEVEQAKQNLDGLVVVEELGRYDYDRDEMFGGFKSGTVEGIQLRDLPYATFGDNAKADGGYTIDPYTGERVEISEENTSDIDTDHIVPLKEITESERVIINSESEAEAIKQDPQLLYDYVDNGESNLTEEEIQSVINDPDMLDNYYLNTDQKKDIANDEDNLAVVGSSSNREKSDQDPGQWMPSYSPMECVYVIDSIKVKDAYGLSVDTVESEAMRDTLENKCS